MTGSGSQSEVDTAIRISASEMKKPCWRYKQGFRSLAECEEAAAYGCGRTMRVRTAREGDAELLSLGAARRGGSFVRGTVGWRLAPNNVRCSEFQTVLAQQRRIRQ
jgi:hypothetical protein